MISTEYIRTPDGTRLACHQTGTGPAVLLVHGFLSNAAMNWINPGIAAAIADAGFRVIMPDFRGHGGSEAPEDAQAYPPDILATDLNNMLDALAIGAFHLVGYSLGARTAVRLVVQAQQQKRRLPQKLVLGGMGLTGIMSLAARQEFFISALENRETLTRGDPGYDVVRFLQSTGAHAQAAIHVLRSQVNSSLDDLARIKMPTLVICGDQDHDNGSAQELANALPQGIYAEIAGDHMSAVVNKALAQEIVTFLKG